MIITVGSTALKYFNMNRREPKDLDIVTDAETYNGFTSGGDIHILPMEVLNLIPTYDEYATPDAIYTMKCSHLAWDVHWQKTKLDILWLKSKGCVLIPKLYNILKEEWEHEYGDKSFLSLKKNKDEFFTDEVTYLYDHDYLHELVSHPSEPMYTRVLQDGEDVLIDKSKFDSLSREDQVRMFREEITVIAAERWLINPYWKGSISWMEAYRLSLKKTITSLTKNWATDFIVKNLEKFVLPDYSYFKHLINTLEIDMGKVNGTELITEMLKSLNGFVERCCTEGEVGDIIADFDRDEFIREVIVDGYDPTEGRIWSSTVGFKHLQQEGGGEGGAEDCHIIFEVAGKTYSMQYSYYSYDGYDFYGAEESICEVEPVQKTVTVYESV